MIRTRAGDLVKVKVQAGATEHEHNMSIHGVKWLQGGSQNGQAPNSGWRNAQGDGISEQFTFISPVLMDAGQQGASADYAYSVDVSQDGWWSGMWGILRNYRNARPDLYELSGGAAGLNIANMSEFDGVCPDQTDNLRQYEVAAVLANDVLSQTGFATNALVIPDNEPTGAGLNNNEGGPLKPAGGTLVYNPRDGQGPLHDPTAMMYVRLDDLEPRFIAGVSPDGTIPDAFGEPIDADDIDSESRRPGVPG
jgi:hypothetical protein